MDDDKLNASESEIQSDFGEQTTQNTADRQNGGQAQTKSSTVYKANLPVNGEQSNNWLKQEQKIKARTEYGQEDQLYETKVREVFPDKFYVDIPKNNDAFVVPPIGTKIFANFIFNNSVYFFQTYLISVARTEGMPVWVLEMPVDFEKIQRRSFLRLDLLLPVRIRVESSDGIFLPPVKTNCLDISGGGIRYVLDFPLPTGKLSKLSVDDFPGVGSIEALCQAVRSVKSLYSDENYWIGAQFVDLPYKIEDKITRYIFTIQKKIVVSSSSE